MTDDDDGCNNDTSDEVLLTTQNYSTLEIVTDDDDVCNINDTSDQILF